MKRRLVSLAIAAVLLGAAVYHVDLRSAWAALADLSPLPLLGALLLQALILLVKARRWGVALRAAAGRPSHGLLPALLLGSAGNMVLPARLGEIARAHLAATANGLPRSLVLTTIAVTQFFDLLVLGLLLLATGLLTATAAVVQPALLFVPVLLGLVALVLLQMIQRRATDFGSLARGATRFLPASARRASAYYAGQFAEGLRLLGERAAGLSVLLYTLAVWGLEIGSYMLALAAFGIPVTLLGATLLVVVLSLAFILPLTPANVGPHQFLCVFVLGLFGVAGDRALALSVGLQAACSLLVLALGTLALLHTGLSLRTLYDQIAASGVPAKEVVPHADRTIPRPESPVPAARSGNPARPARRVRELHVLARPDRQRL